jgi:hypothetical protein
LKLLGAGQTRRCGAEHRLRGARHWQGSIERQNDAVRGEILADRAVVLIVQRLVLMRRVLVAGVAMRGVLMAGVRMTVVMALTAVPMRRGVLPHGLVRRRDMVFQRVRVAVRVSADDVQAGMPEERDRTVQGDQPARGQLGQSGRHGTSRNVAPVG